MHARTIYWPSPRGFRCWPSARSIPIVKTPAKPHDEPLIARRLAERIDSFSAEQITAKAREQATACILDTIGVALAGMKEPCTELLRSAPGVGSAPGSCLIYGSEHRTSALDATLINGTASHALDYDDFSAVMGGHHSVPLVPLLVALGEERGISGKAFLTAYVIGVEVEIRFARAVNYHHYDKGWHPTSTLGIFGAAAAASRLLGLDVPKTATALAIAASLASGIKANFGTAVKPLHVGQCGRNGLLAALLADRGYDAAEDAFENEQGFFNVFNGPGTFDVAKLFKDWYAPLEIAGPTIGLKQFPCCGSTHPAIMMALAIAREEKVTADDVARIEILPHGRRLRHTNNPRPVTALEGKFSVQYVVARALKDNAVMLRHFDDGAVTDPAIGRLLEITSASPHPDMADDSPEQWGAEVIVTTTSGRRIARRVNNLVGRDAANPMSQQELWEKFEDCASRCLPREQITQLFDRLLALERIENIQQLTRLLQIH
jgi:2-methylcitrate dehydratase PrpD